MSPRAPTVPIGWWPSREAKRRIVEQADDYLEGFDVESYTSARDAAPLWAAAKDPHAVGFAIETLLNLAAAYADHPDYRNDWRPAA